MRPITRFFFKSITPKKRAGHAVRAVGRVNDALEGRRFVLIGPGRWGTNDASLGVKVSYAEINHCRALIEVASSLDGFVPDVSYGTHFFQELVEDDIFYLPVRPDELGDTIAEDGLRAAPNALADLVPGDAGFGKVLRVVPVDVWTDGAAVHLAMDSESGEAICWIE